MDALLGQFPGNNGLKSRVSLKKVAESSVSVLQNAYRFGQGAGDGGPQKRRRTTHTDHDTADHMRQLAECIDGVLAGRTLPQSFNEYYYLVESVCRNGDFFALYGVLKLKITDYYRDQMFPAIQAQLDTVDRDAAGSGSAVLQLFMDLYRQWAAKLAKLKLNFLYLENNYLLHSRSKRTCEAIGNELFCASLLAHNAAASPVRLYDPAESKYRVLIFEAFVNAVRGCISAGRPELPTLAHFVDIVHTLDRDQAVGFRALANDLVAKVLDDYAVNPLVLADGTANSDYVENAVAQAGQFVQIMGQYAAEAPEHAASIRARVLHILLFHREYDIAAELLPALIFAKVESVKLLLAVYHEHDRANTAVVKGCRAVYMAKIDAMIAGGGDDLIAQLITFQRQQLAKLAFAGIDGYPTAASFSIPSMIRPAFRASVNSAPNLRTVIDRLNRYIDANLKARDLDRDKLLSFDEIFELIDNKDAFKDVYEVELSRRLIFGATDPERELLVIERFHYSVGPDFSQSLEAMVKDVVESKAFSSRAVAAALPAAPPAAPALAPALAPPQLDFEVLMLGSIHWQFLKKKQDQIKNIEFRIPTYLQHFVDRYDAEWKADTNYSRHKNFEWCHNLSQMTLVRRFAEGVDKTIICNSLQGAILCVFNDQESADVAQIAAALEVPRGGIEEKVLRNHLGSLTEGKHKLLKLDVKGVKYTVNQGFKSRTAVVRPLLRSPVASDHVDSGSATKVASRQKRQGLEQSDKVRAAVIRILKRERRLSHESLSVQVSSTLVTTIVDTAVLKRCIADLIDQEYIKRVDNLYYEYVP